jgi:hypothetical protein
MLLALVDYACYRAQRGRYRPSKVEAAGYKLATRANFSNAYAPRPADSIVMHVQDSPLSWLVMYVTNSLASHVAIGVDQADVIEANVDGVVRHPFADLLDGRSSIQAGSPSSISEEQRAQVVEGAEEMIGAGYSWRLAGWLGLRHIGWARYAHYNPRLYFDTSLVLLVLGRAGFSKRTLCYQATPLLLYGVTLTVNRTIALAAAVGPQARLRRAAWLALQAAHDAGEAGATEVVTSRSRRAPKVAVTVAAEYLLRSKGSAPAATHDQLVKLLHFARSARSSKTSGLATFLYGSLLARNNDSQLVQEGRAVLRTAALHSDSATAGLAGLGLALSLEDEHPAEAADAYRAVIDLKHTKWSPRAGVNLGFLFWRMGEFEQARTVLAWTVQSGNQDASARAGALLAHLSGTGIGSEDTLN